jgi:hypothetical protein
MHLKVINWKKEELLQKRIGRPKVDRPRAVKMEHQKEHQGLVWEECSAKKAK